MELQFCDQCSIYLFIASLSYSSFTAAENGSQSSPWGFTFDISCKCIQTAVNEPMTLFQACIRACSGADSGSNLFLWSLLATAACYFPIEQNGITMEKKKSERALKRFLFAFGDLLPLCSLQWHFLPCVFLHTYVDFFNNRCGVKFFGVRVSSC